MHCRLQSVILYRLSWRCYHGYTSLLSQQLISFVICCSTWYTASDLQTQLVSGSYIQRPAQFSFFIADSLQFYQGMMAMIIKHDKVGVLNPCDNNKMIVNKSSSDSCHVLLQDSMYTLQYSVLLISTHNELTLGAMNSCLKSQSLLQN